MIFITGPLYSGKRTFAQRLPGTRIAELLHHLFHLFQ